MRKKIDGSKKYETVRRIKAGEIRIRHAAEILEVHPSSVQAWVRLYETEGITGFSQTKPAVCCMFLAQHTTNGRPAS